MKHKKDMNPFAIKNQPGKHKPGLFSLLAAAGIFLACSVAAYAILDRQLYTNMLLARNGAEQTLNNLFAVMREESQPRRGRHSGMMRREFPDFAAILEDYPQLAEKIAGIGWYSAAGRILVRYGSVPDLWENLSETAPDFLGEGSFAETPSWRSYAFDEESGNLHVVFHIPAPRMHRQPDGEAEVFLLSLRQNDYWKKNRTAVSFFIGWEVLLLLLIWRVQSLLVKNRAYRLKLAEQKELVALGAAARTLAHEIKNPLSAIQLQADIISRVCPDAVAPELDAITQEVGRLKRLTDRMGDFLREPQGFPVPLDLGEFCRNLLGKAAVRINFSAEEGLWVVADADRLHSIVDNLIRNALESGSPPENVELRVSRLAKGGKPWARVEVLDRGKGIPEEKISRLFDPFFTTKSKGSGLGLAIAWRFALAAGGSLKIENREDGGVRAALEIPSAGEAAKK